MTDRIDTEQAIDAHRVRLVDAWHRNREYWRRMPYGAADAGGRAEGQMAAGFSGIVEGIDLTAPPEDRQARIAAAALGFAAAWREVQEIQRAELDDLDSGTEAGS
jgi:hypothetical protein